MSELVDKIVKSSMEAVLPDKSVIETLSNLELEGNIHIIAIGKAA